MGRGLASITSGSSSTLELAATFLVNGLAREGKQEESQEIKDHVQRGNWAEIERLVRKYASKFAGNVIQSHALDKVFSDDNFERVLTKAGFSKNELHAVKQPLLNFLSKLVDDGLISADTPPDQIQRLITDAAKFARQVSPKAIFDRAASHAPSVEVGRKWVDRDEAEFPTAELFLKEVYAGRLGIEGDLTQAALGKIDSRLMAALDAEFTGERRAELRRLLPTTKERNDALLLQKYGYVPEGDDRKKKVTVLARHKL